MVAVDEVLNSRDAGRKQGFGKHCYCLPLLEWILACKREDREIPAAPPNKKATVAVAFLFVFLLLKSFL